MSQKGKLKDTKKSLKLKEEKFIDLTDNEMIHNKKKLKNEDKNNNNKNKSFLNRKRKRQTPKKNNISAEFKLFYELVDKYGIEKVLASLCKNENDFSVNKMDKIIDKINDSCNKNNFIHNVLKTYFFILKDYINDNPDIKNSLLEKNNYDLQRILPNDNIKEDNNMIDLQFNIDNVIKIPSNKEEEKENNINDDDNNNKNILGLESHYNKNADGNIYKYKIMYLLGELAVFKCADNNCTGDGTFDLGTKLFNDGQKHSKKYSEHDFVINGNIDDDIAYKEMCNNKYIDAQIIYEENAKVVRFYS